MRSIALLQSIGSRGQVWVTDRIRLPILEKYVRGSFDEQKLDPPSTFSSTSATVAPS
jgi:hypothetical protein